VKDLRPSNPENDDEAVLAWSENEDETLPGILY